MLHDLQDQLSSHVNNCQCYSQETKVKKPVHTVLHDLQDQLSSHVNNCQCYTQETKVKKPVHTVLHDLHDQLSSHFPECNTGSYLHEKTVDLVDHVTQYVQVSLP